MSTNGWEIAIGAYFAVGYLYMTAVLVAWIPTAINVEQISTAAELPMEKVIELKKKYQN